MKRLIYGGLSALLLAAAAPAIAGPDTRVQAQVDQRATAMVFNFTAPMITNSGVRGSTHFIRVAVIGMGLQDLMISIPSQMEDFTKLQVTDDSGREIAAKTEVSQGRAAITFTQPVEPGTYVNVEFTGVQMRTTNDGILLYGVTGQRVGLKSEIPIGTARIQLPSRS